MSASELQVWLYGDQVATVAPHPDRVDRITWRWTAAALQRWGSQSRIVSNILPITATSRRDTDVRATTFIQGLLPEGEARVHYAVAAGVEPDDIYGFLTHYGQDTAGGLSFVANRPTLSTSKDRSLTDGDIAARLKQVTSRAAGATLQSTSLAGMVPKIGLNRIGAEWLAPGPGNLSTWILKVGHPEGSPAADVIDTEALCLDLARALGLTTVEAQVHRFEDMRAIAVSRYDRVVHDGIVTGLHQEDLAQAIGLSTLDPARKFQRGARMPSWSHAASVLKTSGSGVAPLAKLVAFSYLVGNTDHHAKNTSFLRPPTGSVRLAPAYDIAAHLHHEGSHLSALDLAGERSFDRLTTSHVTDEISSWGVPASDAAALVANVAQSLGRALADIDRAHHPGVPLAAWDMLMERSGSALSSLTN
ncbi:type II toxin-antitoxin system HipA family toxin [Ornithinimicrobium sp. INDO-MA30-4]|uniref:type II toxin-antitoxin system HipA family toxin n=1 Tax=Ornithinimicrobium sp. INDO-MA30-4 TaxID=2908651 RepID=UPI001F3E8413|nr:HipA domain-containing protein [Ornithinimicrobium sp. INDO-MA30-4]UJH70403.1 HipA domain-containing protein [Ornithinimicrobium sp. INDO-MA30-4]